MMSKTITKLLVITSLASILLSCQHQKNALRLITPESLFPADLNESLTPDGRKVRKGVVAAANANLNQIKAFFENKEIITRNQAIGAINSLRILIPDLTSLELFEIFPAGDLFQSKQRGDRIVLGILYKQYVTEKIDDSLIPTEVSSLIAESLAAPSLRGISPSDLLPDGEDYAQISQAEIRKGTIFATLANIKALSKAQTAQERTHYCNTLKTILVPKIRALMAQGFDIFDYFLLDNLKPQDPYKLGKETLRSLLSSN